MPSSLWPRASSHHQGWSLESAQLCMSLDYSEGINELLIKSKVLSSTAGNSPTKFLKRKAGGTATTMRGVCYNDSATVARLFADGGAVNCTPLVPCQLSCTVRLHGGAVWRKGREI